MPTGGYSLWLLRAQLKDHNHEDHQNRTARPWGIPDPFDRLGRKWRNLVLLPLVHRGLITRDTHRTQRSAQSHGRPRRG